MNIIETYENMDHIRKFIICFGLAIEKYHRGIPLEFIKTDLELLLYHNIRNEIFEISKNECRYWEEYLHHVWKADHEKNYLYTYDFLEELKGLLYGLLNVVWQNFAHELCDYIWQQNARAIKSRYPEILSRIEHLGVENNMYGVREYGLGGRVVYLKCNGQKRDLYSEFDSSNFSLQVLKQYNLEKCRKIFMWLIGCDFEINVVWQMCEDYHTILEVYVSSLEAFYMYLQNTVRAGILQERRINFHFEYSIDKFIQDIDLAGKCFIYAGAYSLNTDERDKLVNYTTQNNIDYSICELI